MKPDPADVADYYDRYWSPDNPGGRHGAGPGPLERIRNELAAQVHPETRVLDFGCGDGSRYGRWLAERAGSYLGLDVSEVALTHARQAGLEVRQIESESDLGVPAGAFDVALTNQVLEHIFAPQEAVRELHRALAPGGILVATVPNVAYWVARVRLGVLGRWNAGGDQLSAEQPWRDPHLRFFTLESLRQLLRGAGFSEVAMGGFAGAFLAELPLFRRFPIGEGSALYRSLEARLPSLLGARLVAVARKG